MTGRRPVGTQTSASRHAPARGPSREPRASPSAAAPRRVAARVGDHLADVGRARPATTTARGRARSAAAACPGPRAPHVPRGAAGGSRSRGVSSAPRTSVSSRARSRSAAAAASAVRDGHEFVGRRHQPHERELQHRAEDHRHHQVRARSGCWPRRRRAAARAPAPGPARTGPPPPARQRSGRTISAEVASAASMNDQAGPITSSAATWIAASNASVASERGGALGCAARSAGAARGAGRTRARRRSRARGRESARARRSATPRPRRAAR